MLIYLSKLKKKLLQLITVTSDFKNGATALLVHHSKHICCGFPVEFLCILPVLPELLYLKLINALRFEPAETVDLVICCWLATAACVCVCVCVGGYKAMIICNMH
jgi:hypothetical protein